MIRTQIQLPDRLYHDLKRLAASREWSLAETLRRAAEQFLARYPATAQADWKPPTSSLVGWTGLTHEQVREAALADATVKASAPGTTDTPESEAR
tara:strand:- start:312 stop:596 length:285 start_codon:yes stop_codon:yes gene_type:complete